MASLDFFLKIDGIQGESQDAKHKNEIELLSFSWGETNAGGPGRGTGGGASKVNMQDLAIVMPVSRASPPLFLACASGQHIKSAVLTGRKAGKEQQEFLKYTFSDLVVSAYETGASHEAAMVTDQVAFNFGRIEVEYRPQKPDGTLDAAVKAGWDVKANRPV